MAGLFVRPGGGVLWVSTGTRVIVINIGPGAGSAIPINMGSRPPLIEDCGLRIADCRLPIADCRLRIADCGLPIADCRLRIADCGLPIADCRLPIADCGLKSWEMGTGRGFGFVEGWVVALETPFKGSLPMALPCHPEARPLRGQLRHITNLLRFITAPDLAWFAVASRFSARIPKFPSSIRARKPQRHREPQRALRIWTMEPGTPKGA